MLLRVGSKRNSLMDVTISRNYQVRQTLGGLFVVGFGRVIVSLVTLELPYLDNQKRISCIPEGVYDCTRIHSRKYGVCYLVENVPNRDDILIHIGNFATGNKVDTSGCILVGLNHSDINEDGFVDVAYSTIAMNVLRALLPSQFKLTIK